VTITTSKTKRKVSEKSESNILLNDANNNTIAILIKLLATNIVASNRLGVLNNLATSILFLNVFESESNCDCVNEKKATSAPDINAEHINNTNNATTLISALLLNTAKEIVLKKLGSNAI
jgi:hypothetical protein